MMKCNNMCCEINLQLSSCSVFCVPFHRHPLFPLLALLFEKCEQSTLSSDCITSASFDVDIENFVRSQEKEGKPFFSEDPELDNLVRTSRVEILTFLFVVFIFTHCSGPKITQTILRVNYILTVCSINRLV